MSVMAYEITARFNCLLNRLFRSISKKTSKLLVTGLSEVDSPVTSKVTHKGPVTRKMILFDDVIMASTIMTLGNDWPGPRTAHMGFTNITVFGTQAWWHIQFHHSNFLNSNTKLNFLWWQTPISKRQVSHSTIWKVNSSQMTFSNAFSWIKKCNVRSRFHRILFPRVQ